MAVGGLDSAISGLKVAQQQLSVLANNISNASTPGYTRKILPQSAVSIQGQGVGVKADTMIRNVDTGLSREFWTQTSQVAALGVTSTYLTKIQQFHGDPALEISISAEMGKLRDQFSALSDSPEDASIQRLVVDQASTVAKKIRNFGSMITQMRNDAQTEMNTSVVHINDLLGQAATLNKKIQQAIYVNRSTAELEDQRDNVIQKLSEEIQVTTFKRSDGVLVVQTSQGIMLADERAETLYFNPVTLGNQSYYPGGGAAGLYVGGNPATVLNAIDITTSDIGGKLGALTDLRDTTLPRQAAEIDELAQKMAQRFDQQGLRLFTDFAGNIPLNTAPVPNPPGPLTPVPYVGFASALQVNDRILADNSLVQTGTALTDLPVPSGSNEVVRRVIDFVFGDVDYQQATGTIDVRAAATGTTTLQQWLGLYSSNTVTGTRNLGTYGDVNALISAGGTVFTPASGPATDKFTLTFEESRTGAGPVTVTIDLSDAMANNPIGGGINDGLDQIIAEINAQITAASVPASLAAVAGRNAYGQMVITTRGDLTIDASGAGGMGDAGLTFLGLTADTYETTDPYIDIQVGNDPSKRVTIEPGDDETDLLAKLEYDPLLGTGVPGLYANIGAGGRLTLRPGGDDSNGGPRFGGDIKILGGPFATNGTGGAGIASGSNVLQALFGSNTPVTSVPYTTTGPFRTGNLGPGANIDTGVLGSSSILDYGQKMISRQTEEITQVNDSSKDETNYRDLVKKQLLDQSGVNIDEELATLIIVQTAYSASARAITAINSTFQELLDAFR